MRLRSYSPALAYEFRTMYKEPHNPKEDGHLAQGGLRRSSVAIQKLVFTLSDVGLSA